VTFLNASSLSSKNVFSARDWFLHQAFQTSQPTLPAAYGQQQYNDYQTPRKLHNAYTFSTEMTPLAMLLSSVSKITMKISLHPWPL
jgi:hypothetical protein